MLFRKKLLVCALAANFLSLPSFADLNLETANIEQTTQGKEWLQIDAPNAPVLKGEAVELDFIVPQNSQIKAIHFDGMRVDFPDGVTGGKRFQGKLYGATENAGSHLIFFEFYNPYKGIYSLDIELVVKDSAESSDIQKLNIRSPQDGQILQQGEDLFIDFTMPTGNLRMQSISVNDRQLFISWASIPAGVDYINRFSGYTQNAGPLKVAFNYYRTSDGQAVTIEKNLSVSGVSATEMQVISPREQEKYNLGEIMPIEVVPSSTNKDPRFFIFVANNQVAEITGKPYRFDYLIPTDSNILGNSEVRIDEFDGENLINEKWIPIELIQVSKQAKVTLEMKQGTAAVEQGKATTILAKVQGYANNQPISDAEFNKEIKAVEFYLNDMLVETDNTAPYEFTRQYLNTQAEQHAGYSTHYKLSARAILNDQSASSDSAPDKTIEAIPAAGAKYCLTAAPAWNANTAYNAGDAVMDKGFFFVATSAHTGSRPEEQKFVGAKSVWAEVNCSDQFIAQSEPSIVGVRTYSAKIGERLEIKGAVKLPEDRSLSKLVMKNEAGHETVVAVDGQGKFSFSYLFEGQSNCLSNRCDRLYFEAIDNLQYPHLDSIVVQDSINDYPATIEELYSKVLGDKVHVDALGRDDGLYVTASVYAEDSKTLLASQEVRVEQYGNHLYRPSLSFAKPKEEPSFYTLEIKDEAGQITKKAFKPSH